MFFKNVATIKYMQKKKGVTLIFEQVMLFAISVAIFLVSFSVFSLYQGFYISVAHDNQLDETKEWISTSILKVAEKGGANSSLVVPLPRQIGDAIYEISLSDEGLTLRNLLTNTTKFSTLYGLSQTFSLSGTLTSDKGKITIKKEGDQIIIV